MSTSMQTLRVAWRRERSVTPPRIALAAVFVAQFFLAASGNSARQPRVVTSTKQVRALPPAEASLGLPLRLRGTVLVLSGWKNSFFLSDGGVGISVDRDDTAPELRSGDEVEITGRTSAGLFAPVIISTHIRVLGRARLPPAPLRNYSELVSGAMDSQWIQVRGVVHAAWIAQSWGRSVLFLDIGMGEANITARVHDFDIGDSAISNPSSLVDAEVLISGVCGTNFNERRQLVGVRLFVTDMNAVAIVRPAPADPFSQPTQPLESLHTFGLSGLLQHRIRVSGTVTYQKMGSALYIQDHNEGLYIETAQATPDAIGRKVDAVGFVAAGPYSPQLRAATFRVAGPGQNLAPIALRASDVIRTNADGFPTSIYDGVLVRVRGTLADRVSGANEDVMAMRDGERLFRVLLPKTAGSEVLSGLRIGSELELTGVISVQSDEGREPLVFVLRLRSPADVAVIRAASWWDRRHALYALIVVTLAALASSITVVLLRRTIRHQVDVVRQSLEKLKSTQRKLGMALAAGQLGAFEVNLVTGEIWMSVEHARIFGYDAPLPTFNRATFLQHVLAEDRDAVQEILEKTTEGDSVNYECRIQRTDGAVRWISVVAKTFHDEPPYAPCRAGAVQDITERKLAQDEIRRLTVEHTAELTAANQELEAFAYTAAHDLRAPLRHMHGFVSFLRLGWYDKLDEDGRRCLDKIAHSSKEMGQLLDDLLNYSRLGRTELRQEQVSLNRMVSRIQEELQPDLAGRDIAWVVGELPEVVGDPPLLHQVLFNFLSNAVKYTRKTGRARVEIGSTSDGGDSATVFVRDNGAGFEMQYVHKLFRVFQRLHVAEDFEGTGIGLAIVRRIVERHGGRTWAEGTPSQGATFYFSLPLRGQHGKRRVHTAGR